MDKATKRALGLGTAGALSAIAMAVSDYHNNNVALAFGSAALCAYVFAGWHHLFGGGDDNSSATERDLRDAPNALSEPSGVGFPNWPVRELVRHLKPWLLLNKDQQEFDPVASEIRDRLATGQLAAWGRERPAHGETMPLFPIPPNYWLYAKLHIWLLDEGGAGEIVQTHVSEPSAPNQTQYGEVQINRAQALTIWTTAAPTPTIQDHRAKWGELRTIGVGLRNEGITGFIKDSDWIRWAGEVTFWNEEVIRAISHVNAADAELFRTLDEVPPPRFPMDSIFASEEHKHLHAMHDFRLKKLEKLIEDYRHKI